MMRSVVVLVLLCTLALQAGSQHGPLQRPFYLFGHMANSPAEVRQVLAAGANAVEADIQFGSSGRPLRLFHGWPCDCFRDCLSASSLPTYLSYLRRLTTPGDSEFDDRLVLVYLDLKLETVDSKFLYAAGVRLAEALIIHYFQAGQASVKAKLVIGVPLVEHENALLGFINTFLYTQYFLLQRIGYDVSNQQQDLGSIQRLFDRLHLQHRAWQGDGISNCLPRSDQRLRMALRLRDFGGGHANKVYGWTIDSTSSIENALRLDVDGIMTNNMPNLVKVLSEPEFRKKYRLATHEDDPWKRIRGKGPLRTGCEQNTCWKDCNFSGDWCWTSVIDCYNRPHICNAALNCSGTCGQRLRHLHTIGSALLEIWREKRQ